MTIRQLGILGSTGSIGRSTLSVVARFADRFAVRTLTARNNVELLAEQIRRFKPDIAVVYDEASAQHLRNVLPSDSQTEICSGESGYCAAAAHPPVDMVVSAMVGAAGLEPTLAAIEAGKDVALANKETLVMAGDLVMDRAADKGVQILPVDSEHSAIFQCLEGNRQADVDRILLTASGGPFLNRPSTDFAGISPDDALAHPTWQMGDKITIDSATLMNKGLEVIEAKHLFGLATDQIEVVVHPQSIVHSMVAYRDGSILAQMGLPDMKGAIAYALSYPERLPLGLALPDFADLGRLTFQAPDLKKFVCLALAYEACRAGGTLPAVMNAANEIAVSAFLSGRIGFDRIPAVIQTVMNQYAFQSVTDIEAILAADGWGRRAAEEIIAREERGSGVRDQGPE